MSTYPPPQHTLQPHPPPPPAAGPGAYARSRATSTASMNDRYVPDSYKTPEPGSLPEPTGYFPITQQQRPRGPSINGQPIASTPPMPNSLPSSLPAAPYGQSPMQPSYPVTPAYTPGPSSAYTPGAYPSTQAPALGTTPPYPQAVNELRPPHEGPRRRSDASTHSRRSHRSHHSGSRRSDESQERVNRRRRSYEDEYDYDYEKERRHRERARRASAPDPDGKDKLSRTKTHRPTLGDTVYSSFRNIKYWLGPRDKY